MRETSYCQVAFMPYAPIKKSFEIGGYEIWPYFEERSKRMTDPQVVQYLDHLFGRYFERKYDYCKKCGYDEPIREIFIVSPKHFEIGAKKFTKRQLGEIRAISHIVSFCSINERAFVSSSADAFILYIQNFQIGSDGIAFWDKSFSTLDMVKFIKPYYIGTGPLQFEVTDFCTSLGKVLHKSDTDQTRRIFRCLELFYHTATHGEMVLDEHKLLSLVMCFEVLLEFKHNYQFAERIEELPNLKITPEIRCINKHGKSVRERKSKTSWWAFDLYNLRSSIVHGEAVKWEIEKYGDIWTRIRFGGFLLMKLIKKILSEMSIWQPDYRQHIIDVGPYSLDEKLLRMTDEFTRRHKRYRSC